MLFDDRLAVQTSLGIHRLDGDELEPLWLEARSVPSASLVPCVRDLPVGWELAEVAVNGGRSVLTLDHHRAGERALVVRPSATCDPNGAVEGPSPTAGCGTSSAPRRTPGSSPPPGTTLFPGGCVTSRLHLTMDPTGEFADQAPQVLGFTTRAALREALAVRTGGRLQPDQGEAP